MAFALTATNGTNSITLSNSSPYSLVDNNGMGGAEVRRVTTRGPAQDGDTDKGFRLNPREMELTIGIKAATDALLDTYRDALIAVFKPLPSTAVNLRVTRDDAVVRQLDCFVVGAIKISLVKDYRPGHYCKAVIRLRAPDPAYYNPTQGSVSVVGTSLAGAQWWLAGGAIDTSWVEEHGTVPTQGQVWTYTGTPGVGGYTIAFRGTPETLTNGKYAFFAGNASGSPAISFSTYGTTGYRVSASYPDGGLDAGNVMTAGTHNYFVIYEDYDGASSLAYMDRDGGTQVTNNAINTNYRLAGTARRWRSDATNSAASRWTSAIEKYAVYNFHLVPSQLDALSLFMSLQDNATNAQYLPISYLGNLPEYPTISITGPVTNPSVTNLTTGDALDFGTITIGAGTTYVINTHPVYKTVLMGTVNKRGELTKDSDLGDFHIAPSPVATGGTNVFFLNGTAMGTATRFSVTYYHRYTSF